jgi:hypothetical protein
VNEPHRDLTDGLTAIHARFVALAEEQQATATVDEVRLIRARLCELAAANAYLGDRLGQALGLKQTRAAIPTRRGNPSNGCYAA